MVRPQKVSVDVWKMILGSCSYLGLAFAAWVFLKLVTACFWLPEYLRKDESQAVVEEKQKVADFNQALLKYQERIDEDGEKKQVAKKDAKSLHAEKSNTDDYQENCLDNEGKLPDKKNN